MSRDRGWARSSAAVRRLADRARTLPSVVVDAMLAVACFLIIAIYNVLHDGLDWWVVALAVANTLPLIWRRRYPLLVTAFLGVSTTWLAIVDRLGELPMAQLVATYTFAALCPPVERLIAIVGTAVGITLSITLHGDELLNLGPNVIVFVAAYALGTSARARRARIDMLEERARRLAEEQESAASRERERIAREMHDILAHSMSLVVVQAEAGPVVARSDPGKAEEIFDSISATARDALAQLRRALSVLRPDETGRQPQPGLNDLPQLVARVRGSGLAATLEEHGEPCSVPADLAATAYRIVQESLTNTVKHARATSATVRLDWGRGALNLEVRDDGRGPTRDAEADLRGSGGRGLVGMRERVSSAGGELSYGPGPGGGGFRVAATLPLQ